MTFEETYETTMKHQETLQKSLINMTNGVNELAQEHEDLKAKNKELEQEIEELKKEKKRLQETIVILTRPDD